MQALPIGPRKYDFDLTLNGSAVTKLRSIRILGVELDGMLNRAFLVSYASIMTSLSFYLT